MENKIFYLPKFQDPAGTLPESTEYYGGTLNSAKVSAILSRDQWNNLYKQGKVSLSQIPRKYQSWIEAENSEFKQDITDAIDRFGRKYVAPALFTAISASPILGTGASVGQFIVDAAMGNWLGAATNAITTLPGFNFLKTKVGKKIGIRSKLGEPGHHYRIVDQPAIDDAIESGVIRAKTGLHHDTVSYLKQNYGEYLPKIPNWEKMTGDEIIEKLANLGAIERNAQGKIPLNHSAKTMIRSSTNHGGTVSFFKGMPYPNYTLHSWNKVIDGTEDAAEFTAGHHGKIFTNRNIKEDQFGPSVLIENGTNKGATAPTENFTYWEYHPFFEGWQNKKFKKRK